MKSLLFLLVLVIVIAVAYFVLRFAASKLGQKPARSTPPPLAAPTPRASVVDPSRVCERGGLLVGPKARLPEDVRYFQTAGSKFPVGCNRMRCKLCGEMVRQQSGFSDIEPQAATQAVREIYATPDLAQSKYLKADPESRLYVCACTFVTVKGGKCFPFPNDNWRCAGHPPTMDGKVLPPISAQAASDFVVQIANSEFQQARKAVAITYTNGEGAIVAPGNISLGEGLPKLHIWENNTQKEVDFVKVAGGCVQLTDDSITAY